MYPLPRAREEREEREIEMEREVYIHYNRCTRREEREGGRRGRERGGGSMYRCTRREERGREYV